MSKAFEKTVEIKTSSGKTIKLYLSPNEYSFIRPKLEFRIMPYQHDGITAFKDTDGKVYVIKDKPSAEEIINAEMD